MLNKLGDLEGQDSKTGLAQLKTLGETCPLGQLHYLAALYLLGDATIQATKTSIDSFLSGPFSDKIGDYSPKIVVLCLEVAHEFAASFEVITSLESKSGLQLGYTIIVPEKKE